MTSEMRIRDVTVELLRAGPPHNQLLSPLTQYLGMCDDSGAQVVSVPFEHAQFLRILKQLRYDSAEDSDRLPVLREVGLEIAKILSSIPELPGAITSDAAGPECLIHLRIVLSSSELALLPFELAKVPVAPNVQDENWLTLQVRAPVCITRRARNVHSQGVRWPAQPRILFIASDPANVPFKEHRDELLKAIEPFLYPGQDEPVISEDNRREQYGQLLTIIQNASYEDVAAECARADYTHIHVLAHGSEDPKAEDRSFGLLLRDAKSGGDDVVSGERFASAIANLATGKIHKPTAVTLAACDSANEGSVTTPGGASFAHVLHQTACVPMVVASQFPLSKEGSVSMVQNLYQGLLWGANPWIMLHRIRTDLHGRFLNRSHDWASLVVYEALPGDLPEQLEEMTYYQSKKAINAALQRVDLAVQNKEAGLDPVKDAQLFEKVQQACSHLPLEGRFGMECLGLRASSSKRLAHAEYNMALAAPEQSPERRSHLVRCYEKLDQAFLDYLHATRGFLVNQGRPAHRIASLHWVLVQMLSIAAVTGKPVQDGSWETAKLSAEAYLDHPDLDERAWAHGSLAELWLLKLADSDITADRRETAAKEAVKEVSELVALFPWSEAFPVTSTCKQFARYVEWWGQEVFEQGLMELNGTARSSWAGKGRLLETASELIRVLDRSRRRVQPKVEEEAPALRETKKREAARPEEAAAAAGDAPTLMRRVRNLPDEPTFEIEMLPAGHGDSLWIQYGDRGANSQILIDCGTADTYQSLRKRVAAQADAKRRFELFILTHIDDDHIGGAIPFFSDRTLGVSFGDIWFNGWKHLGMLNAKEGEMFSVLIQDNKLPWNEWRKGGSVVLEGEDLPVCELEGGMQLTLLSPTQPNLALLGKKWKKEVQGLKLHPGEADDFRAFLRRTPSTSTDVSVLANELFKSDESATNGSCIAVLAEYGGKSVLLAGDAHAPVLVASIGRLLKRRGQKKLKIDAFKVAHHASQNNLNIELMNLLDCRNYLVSTNGARFNHPDREAIGRIIKYGGKKPRLHFNFLSDLNEVWGEKELQEKYGYEAIYPDPGQTGLRVRL